MWGFADTSKQEEIDRRFLAVPDASIAGDHLRRLTAAPHVAGTPEDRATAEYVAQKFREAGLDTEIAEYKVWLPFPTEVRVEIIGPCEASTSPAKPQSNSCPVELATTESPEDTPSPHDRQILPGFNAYSPSADIEGEIVYANYGRQEDFDTLTQMGVDVRGKIALVRYGETYRGVKPYVAQSRGVAGVILYSDPQQDGYVQGDTYPKGPWRPYSALQRGSVGYRFEFPGDPTTPGVASVLSLPGSKRTSPRDSAEVPKIPTTPLSAKAAASIMAKMGGLESPRGWQGALPYTYHLGPGPVRVHIRLRNDDSYRTIWDVVGRVRGSDFSDEWVVAGNHRDAWVYGAVDPTSGTAALLETVHGIGALLKSGWRPKRTLVFGSWDAEEWGLIGSVEWVEQHEDALAHAVAYINMDTAVSGPRFGASAVPSLKQFVRDVAKAVPSADRNGSVYDAWRRAQQAPQKMSEPQVAGQPHRSPVVQVTDDVPVGDLGSGSDYTGFLQHAGVPATDITSSGPYGVYHSVFDDFAWFTKFADPDFRYEQQMARVFGIEVLHMADADILPYDYEMYGKEIAGYIQLMQKRADAVFGSKSPSFAAAAIAAKRFADAGSKVAAAQRKPGPDNTALNRALRDAERALLLPGGLSQRPWFRHAIYAPGRFTGYGAAVLPGVADAVESRDAGQAEREISRLATALNRAASIIEKYR